MLLNEIVQLSSHMNSIYTALVQDVYQHFLLTGYVIEMRENGSSQWTPVNSARTPAKLTSYTVENLDKDQQYDFRILAKNRAGLSQPSDSSGLLQPKAKLRKATAPGLPQIDDVTRSSVDLSWTKPRNDGGSRIKGYMVQKKRRGGDWEDALDRPVVGESCTVPGLTPEEEYEFRVAAVTEAGAGDASVATSPTVIRPRRGL